MMALMFHVFVAGAKDASPAGVKRLAQAMAEHYGLSAADMQARFASGRFRVKSNCDRATADQYKRDLEHLGAIVMVEAATAANSYPTPPVGVPTVKPAEPVKAPEPVKAGQPNYASGLSAAFSGDMPAASLGALENAAAGGLSLASVDGSDTAGGGASEAAFGPPDAAALPASIGPAPEKPKATDKKPARPKDEPLDLFMPPDAEDAEMKVNLADDEVERNAKKRASTPPPVADEPPGGPASTPATRRSQPSIPVQNATSLAPERGHPLGDERVRLVAGVVLAILIGFVPAHFVASMRESSAFGDIDEKVMTAQKEATTPDDYAHLDEVRASLLDRKRSDRRSIAIMAFAIWGVVGAGVAYGWFRRIDWSRFET
jgi:hypothetical protein